MILGGTPDSLKSSILDTPLGGYPEGTKTPPWGPPQVGYFGPPRGGQNRAKIVPFNNSPIRDKIGHFLPDFCHNFGQFWPLSGQILANLGHFSGHLGHILCHLGHKTCHIPWGPPNIPWSTLIHQRWWRLMIVDHPRWSTIINEHQHWVVKFEKVWMSCELTTHWNFFIVDAMSWTTRSWHDILS